jgi:hypothetical protein
MAIDVGIGEVVVYVPADACVTSDVSIGAGLADIFDRDHEGLDVAFAESGNQPAGRPTLHIDGDLGLGVLEVVREGAFPDETHDDPFSVSSGRDGGLARGTNCA